MSAELLDTPAASATPAGPPHPLAEFWTSFRANKGAVIGLAIIVAVFLMAVPCRRDRARIRRTSPTTRPSSSPVLAGGRSLTYPLGTDAIGRDILSRLIHGARLSLSIGVAVVAVDPRRHDAGARRGLHRGATGIVIMRVMDIILTLPSLLLAIVIVAILGPADERDAGGRRGGAAALRPHRPRGGDRREIEGLRHRRPRQRGRPLAPHAVGGAAELRRAAHRPGLARRLDGDPRRGGAGFLGLGAQPPSPEWGTMLADAREFVLRAWWVVTFPGLIILVTVLAFNLVGDGLRDAPRPQAEAVRRPMPLLDIQNLSVAFPSAGGTLRAVDGVSLTLEEGEVLGVVGESGSGKSVTMMALMGLVAYPGRVSADRLAFAGRDLLGCRRASAAASPPRRGDDLPGADHQPQSLLHDRLPDHRVPAPASRARSQGREEAGDRTFRAGRHPGGREPALVLSAPALRRHEPAGDDRDGDRLQPEAPHRRRADDGARRHHPGPDPRPAALAPARARHGAGAHHPQHGRGRRDRRPDDGDVCRPGDGGAAGESPVRPRPSTPTPRLCWRRSRSAARRAARHHPGVVPGLYDRPRRLLFSPRCAYATDHSRDERPALRPGRTAPCAATTRSAIPPATPASARPPCRRSAVPAQAPKRPPSRRPSGERPRRRRRRSPPDLRDPPRPLPRAGPAPGGRRHLVLDRARPTLAVVGESGCGKSTSPAW